MNHLTWMRKSPLNFGRHLDTDLDSGIFVTGFQPLWLSNTLPFSALTLLAG